MWIQFGDKQLAALKRVVAFADKMGDGSSETYDAKIITERLAWFSRPETNDEAFRNAVPVNDELEVDPDAVTSPSDLGAFVMTWTWVSNEEAGIEADEADDDSFQSIPRPAGADLFEEPRPMADRGSSILKSNRGNGYNFVD